MRASLRGSFVGGGGLKPLPCLRPCSESFHREQKTIWPIGYRAGIGLEIPAYMHVCRDYYK